MPVLVRSQRLNEARSLLRRLSVSTVQTTRLRQHTVRRQWAQGHHVFVQHHERQSPIPVQRMAVEVVDESRREDHVGEARKVVRDELQLGRPPADLHEVLAEIALAGPGTTALRALARVAGGGERLASSAVRDGAARVAWSSRIPSCPKIQTNSRLARQAVSIVIAPWRVPDLGRVGGDVGDSGSPYAQGKHRPATGCHAPGRRPGSRPGPHLDQNVLGQLRCGSLGLDSGSLGWPLFRRRAALSAARHPIWRKRGTRKSGLETNAENEARSALLARLW